MHAGAGGRRVVDRRHHLDEAVFHRDFDAEPAELAARLHLHVAEVLGIMKLRMRIERGEHAVDGRLDQLGVFDLLDILGADVLEDVAEQVELPIGVGPEAGIRPVRLHRGGPPLWTSCPGSTVNFSPLPMPYDTCRVSWVARDRRVPAVIVSRARRSKRALFPRSGNRFRRKTPQRPPGLEGGG
jgi:hypothetical protein